MSVKNIVFTADNNYMQHLGVTLISLLKNNANEEFKVFLFSSDITSENKSKIEQIAQPYRCSIEYISFDKKIFEHIDAGRFSIATYYRLLMPKFLKVDKLLYLDVDMVINGSISELYDTELGDSYVAAVEDAWSDKSYLNNLGLSENSRYFNAGVLVVNLKKWREENLFDKFMRFVKETKIRLEAHDQDIFNIIFDGKWICLGLKYNQYEKNPDLDKDMLEHFFTFKEIEDAQNTPVIIHFIGGRKPWHYRNEHIRKNLYWEYLMLTPFNDYKPDDKTIRNIISKNTPQIVRNPKRYLKSLINSKK